jgi:hypothetical protein
MRSGVKMLGASVTSYVERIIDYYAARAAGAAAA